METPSSTRRVTRSQALAASNNSITNSIPVSRKNEDSEKNVSKSKGQQMQDRCALMDLTNDSPIVGVATGGNVETPLAAKQRGSRVKNTPGSGEALLRGQVKTLLQNVEEEALELLAPTPQSQNLSGTTGTIGLASITPFAFLQQQSIPQVVYDGKNQEDLITRSLLLDFSEKSQLSDASEECFELSYEGVVVQGGGVRRPFSDTTEDAAAASIWSMQVNASTHDEEEDDEEEEVAENEVEYYEDVDDDEEGGLLLDELCEGLNNISVNERVVPKFSGKHTRFVYNSDDELVVKEEEEEENSCASPNNDKMLRLKGLPTPKGKHVRFSEEEGREEEGKPAM